MDLLGTQGLKGQMGYQEQKDHQEAEACQGSKDIRVSQESLAQKEARVRGAQMVSLGPPAHLENLDFVEAKERGE